MNKTVLNYDGIGSTLIILHLIAFSGLFIITKPKILTIIFQFILWYFATIALMAGYHRLWSHRTYEASSVLQGFYAFFGVVASQHSALWWAKAHRAHHRNEEQPGDPYNIKKGFYNAHIGWLIHGNDKKEKEEINKTDITDLEKNRILKIQHDYFTLLWIMVNILIILIPFVFWKEGIINSFFINSIRIIFGLHNTYFVNSATHYYGSDRPYNKKIGACENLWVSIYGLGEGWHNYHHTYPKDYRASEPHKFNPTAWFINFTKYLGLSKNHYIKGNREVPTSQRFNTDYYIKT